MTGGSSQGLFVIVSVVIFGIFVGISYILFQDKMTTGLSTIFSDSITQSQNNLMNLSNNSNMEIIDRDGIRYGKIRNKGTDDFGEYTDVWVITEDIGNNELDLIGLTSDLDNVNEYYEMLGGVLSLPDTVGDKKITKISVNISGMFSLQKIEKLPKYTKHFAESNFSGMTTRIFGDNKTFELPPYTETIGNFAFGNDAFSEEIEILVIPENVTYIGEGAFGMSCFKQVIDKTNGKIKFESSAIRMADGSYYSDTYNK